MIVAIVIKDISSYNIRMLYMDASVPYEDMHTNIPKDQVKSIVAPAKYMIMIDYPDMDTYTKNGKAKIPAKILKRIAEFEQHMLYIRFSKIAVPVNDLDLIAKVTHNRMGGHYE